MIDTHCHVDLYPDPTGVAAAAGLAGVLTVVVTNLPSAFERARPYVSAFKNVRLALGLHPLVAAEHAREREMFRALVDETSYIGEVGLDFSRPGYPTKAEQVESFRFVIRALRGKPKFITLHSRRAESAVLDVLEEEGRSPAVFHWYSGTPAPLERALALGHFFSVNPAMTESPNGRKIIDRLPPERVLTESDGPFVKVGGRPAVPADVAMAERHLASVWRMTHEEARKMIRENFLRVLGPLRPDRTLRDSPARLVKGG